jgi:hypothetical protein
MNRSTIATSTATAMVNRRWPVSVTPAMRTSPVSTRAPMGRARSSGQIHRAMKMSATISETVTTILTTSWAPSMPRMMKRSMPAPNKGAITSTTRKNAGHVGTPHDTCTCQ